MTRNRAADPTRTRIQDRPVRVTVRNESDAVVAKQTAADLAKALEFRPVEIQEIVLAAKELAANIAVHGGGGEILFSTLRNGNATGIQIEALDEGPGIPYPEEAFRDGHTSGGSLGYGLGTVNRCMDDVQVLNRDRPPGGCRICCQRWKHAQEESPISCPLDIGAASRPHPAMRVNGDAFVIHRSSRTLLAAVIDGLGHGQFAHRASMAARHYIEKHADRPLDDLFRGVGRTCRATRGVVMALARIDWGAWSLSFGSVGNVEARAFDAPERIQLQVRRGILGKGTTRPVITQHPWSIESTLFLFSDGIRSRWKREDLPHAGKANADQRAWHLVRTFGRDNDDATAVVIQRKPEGLEPGRRQGIHDRERPQQDA